MLRVLEFICILIRSWNAHVSLTERFVNVQDLEMSCLKVTATFRAAIHVIMGLVWLALLQLPPPFHEHPLIPHMRTKALGSPCSVKMTESSHWHVKCVGAGLRECWSVCGIGGGEFVAG